jgi:hypothetical protein
MTFPTGANVLGIRESEDIFSFKKSLFGGENNNI